MKFGIVKRIFTLFIAMDPNPDRWLGRQRGRDCPVEVLQEMNRNIPSRKKVHRHYFEIGLWDPVKKVYLGASFFSPIIIRLLSSKRARWWKYP
jgi:hypothetical protein